MSTVQEDRLVQDWWAVVREVEELRVNLQNLGYCPRILQAFDGAPIKGSLTKVIPEPCVHDWLIKETDLGGEMEYCSKCGAHK